MGTSSMDIDEALHKMCETGNDKTPWPPSHTKHACEVMVQDWEDEIHNYFSTRKVFDLKSQTI